MARLPENHPSKATLRQIWMNVYRGDETSWLPVYWSCCCRHTGSSHVLYEGCGAPVHMLNHLALGVDGALTIPEVHTSRGVVSLDCNVKPFFISRISVKPAVDSIDAQPYDFPGAWSTK